MVGLALGRRKARCTWNGCSHFCRLRVSPSFKQFLLPECLIFLCEIEAWAYPKSEGTQTVNTSLDRERVVGG